MTSRNDDCAQEKKLFAEIWEEREPIIRARCVAWMGGRLHEGNEAYSRAALVAFQKFQKYATSVRDMDAWLLKLAYHVCMDLYREWEKRCEDSFETVVSLLLPSGGDPENLLLGREFEGQLHRWLAELPPRLRHTMRLYVIHEMRYREIATVLSVTEANVRKRVQQAREILRARLESYLSGERAPPWAAAHRELPESLQPLTS